MTESTQNDGEMTRPDDKSHAEWLLRQQMAGEVERKKRKNPNYFEETTIPKLEAEDVIEPTTVVRSMQPELSEPSTVAGPTKKRNELDSTIIDEGAHMESGLQPDIQDDITFLHPRDVHTLIEDNRTMRSAGMKEEVDTSGYTELSPSDVISEIEDRAHRASSESPSIEYRYTSDPSVLESSGEASEPDSTPSIDFSFEDTPTASAPALLTMEELSRLWDMPLEEFFEKDKLGNADAYRLAEIVRRDPESPDIRAFIRKIAPSALDYEIFWHNLNHLSPQFIQAVLVTGSYQEVNLDIDTGHQKTVVIYSGGTLKKSGMGHVFFAQMADSENLTLKEVLIKVPLEKELEMETYANKAAFEDEINITRLFKRIARDKPDDPRLKHLLQPVYQGKGFLVMKAIRNRANKSEDLMDIARNPEQTTQSWAKCLAGGAKGANLAAECGLIDVDLKPSNIMDSEGGGVLIDWGGFMERDAFERGEISVRTNTDVGNLYPLVENGLKQMYNDRYWELNNGNVQRTPNYISLHLLSQELTGQMPVGTVHKFGFYRIMERYFLIKRKAQRKAIDFMMLNEMEKLNDPPLEIPISRLDPAEQLLYDLYLKLHHSHRHPYRFINNDPNHGIDPEYISMEEVIARLDEISNLNL